MNYIYLQIGYSTGHHEFPVTHIILNRLFKCVSFHTLGKCPVEQFKIGFDFFSIEKIWEEGVRIKIVNA